jgi:hypothetical protein
MTLDAMNVNNSSITSISKDLRTSLQEYTKYQKFANNSGALTRQINYTTDWHDSDRNVDTKLLKTNLVKIPNLNNLLKPQDHCTTKALLTLPSQNL